MEEVRKYEIVKFVDGELELEVNVSLNENTVWLNQEQLASLFGVNISAVNKHIKNILSENELDELSTISKMEIVRFEGDRRVKRIISYYNLDMIISIGYRVKSRRGVIFRQWANKVLKEYLLKGYVINENRVIVSNENYIELRNEVANINNRLEIVEDKVLNKEYGLDKIFYNGEFYDAYSLIQEIFSSSNNEIIIIDNYIDKSVLDRQVVKKKSVNIDIYTDYNKSNLTQKDIIMFNKQYGNINVINTNKVHDRYIIIDKSRLYHLGHSIKDLGKKIFSIIESDNRLIGDLLSRL